MSSRNAPPHKVSGEKHCVTTPKNGCVADYIMATRVGLDLSCMTRSFKNIHWPQAIKRLATKKDLGPFKIDRAVVDSNRSVNLLFNIRKILCTYPRKRKDIRDLKMFQIGDLSSFLAGGLTCIRRGDLFVSWSGCREDPRRPDSIKHFDKQFYFN